MAPLKRLSIALALTSAAPLHAETVAGWRSYIAQASLRFGVPTAWVERVIRAESNGQTKLAGMPIRSRAGAIGLMQLMPGTWETIRHALGLGSNPDDPRDNILAGTFYLRMMYDRFGYPGLFAAYNAGPARYAAHLTSGKALPSETIAYLQTVGGARSAATRQPRDVLFAVRSDVPRQAKPPALIPSQAPLFVVRRDGEAALTVAEIER